MRMLTLDEVGFVSGGDDEPMQEVVVNGRRMSPEDIQNMMDFLKRHTQMDGGGRFAGDGGSGAGGDDNLEEVVVEAPKMTEDETLLYGACVTAAMLAGHHLGEKYVKWLVAQLMMRAGVVVGSVAGPGGAVVGGVAGYHAGAQWGEKHGAVYGAAAGTLIGSQACPKD